MNALPHRLASVPEPCLARLAEAQGRAWARVGADVRAKLKVHSPHWPGDRRQKMKLVLACLAGAREGRSQ